MYVSYPTPQISESAFGEPELEQMPPEVPTLRWLAFCGFTVLQTLTAPPTPPHRRREVAPGVRRKLTDGRTDRRTVEAKSSQACFGRILGPETKDTVSLVLAQTGLKAQQIRLTRPTLLTRDFP